ncbi:MAG: hypothetical protein ABJF04_16225 [Reichenbachiella sp.]|uniref:hypothetical protein n=1 Tax=Reichenbachiella sp. TaxID=2184521 RepID=UPI003262D92B
MDQEKLFRILKNPAVHWSALLIVLAVLFKADSGLNEPQWLYVFEMSEEDAKWLSRGMAAIYLIFAFVSARLLARGDKVEFRAGVAVFLILNIFSYFGQEVAMVLQDKDPLDVFLRDGEPKEETTSIQSYRALISVGLTMTLFAAAVFIEFLVARAEEEVKDDRKKFSLSSLYRWFQSKILILQGVYDRALNKPTSIAEDQVNKQIENRDNEITECKLMDQQLKGEQQYQLELIELMHQQRIAIIKAVYANKPSFFKSLFS